eukprot:CAMPEP_0172156720 /NCGR_PEP_ID=MMETSP1050-20130122/3379_1 /TAXON_ID=233186 /ORGANISM="Cryptomonas curvata, Strain CCAP979/52" /LENGTH=177 /DNA_ID=CAMNT_0012825843 /DNA_START=236 /DNA_END=769 /DNA_ORIENTATION=+
MYKAWEKGMRGGDNTRDRKSSNHSGPSSTPATVKVKAGTAESLGSAKTGAAESKMPSSHTAQTSASGLRSYSPSASYFIPTVSPTQGWDAKSQAQLEWAVQQAARETKVRPPGYRAMQQLKLEIARGYRPSIYNDRFWERVCKHVPKKTIDECLLKYADLSFQAVAVFGPDQSSSEI